jgi:integrase
MSRPVVTYTPVERGIQKVTRTYDDGRVVESHRIKYADANGRIVTRTIPGAAKHARAALAEARDEVNKGKHVVISKKDSRQTFLTVARHWLDHSTHLKASTQQTHRRVIEGSRLAPLHDVTMRALTHEQMQAFQKTLTHLAPATQRQLLWIVKAVCDDAVDRGLLKTNPCVKLKKPKARRARVSMPTEKEMRLLRKRLSSPTPPTGSEYWNRPQTRLERDAGKPPVVDPRWRLIVETAAFTGLRAGELRGLKVEDFDKDKRTLNVLRSIPTNGVQVDTPKSRAGTRTVRDIPPFLCDALEDLSKDMRPGDYLFGRIDKDGVSHPYNHMNFYRRIFRPACRELGIDGRFHDLRHFHASLLIAAGMDPVRVAARLGHEKPSFTLDVYSHLFDREKDGLGALLDAEWGDNARAASKKRKKGRKPF